MRSAVEPSRREGEGVPSSGGPVVEVEALGTRVLGPRLVALASAAMALHLAHAAWEGTEEHAMGDAALPGNGPHGGSSR